MVSKSNRAGLVLALVVWFVGTLSAEGALVSRWEMDNPSPLDDSVGGNHLLDPGGAASPTHLSTGGVNGTGAFQFDGTAQTFTLTAGNTNIASVDADWTVNFWIKSDDGGTAASSTIQVPVLGEQDGDRGFGIGLDGGKVTVHHYGNGWFKEQSSTTVADNQWHMATVVHHGAGTLDIYVDGALDVAGLNAHDDPTPPATFPYYPYDFTHIGSTYQDVYADMTLDDLSIFDTALTEQEVASLIPEPASLGLLGLGGAMLMLGRRDD